MFVITCEYSILRPQPLNHDKVVLTPLNGGQILSDAPCWSGFG